MAGNRFDEDELDVQDEHATCKQRIALAEAERDRAESALKDLLAIHNKTGETIADLENERDRLRVVIAELSDVCFEKGAHYYSRGGGYWLDKEDLRPQALSASNPIEPPQR